MTDTKISTSARAPSEAFTRDLLMTLAAVVIVAILLATDVQDAVTACLLALLVPAARHTWRRQRAMNARRLSEAQRTEEQWDRQV